MARLTDDVKAQNEEAVRAAMDRLLRGELPTGGKLDLKTLAVEAGVPRTGFYAKRNRDGSERPGPYQHLGEEFLRRLATLQAAGEAVDPRDTQIARLKAANQELQERVAKRNDRIQELTDFQKMALSRLDAQHEEIVRLRGALLRPGHLRPLPTPSPATPSQS
ncbi:hypothetical protein [Streptomyces sp. NPDC023838]|uniref:hypothetical protein n=1 Tax=Streptomyces sp. NPDC023838 TaxID=3154325 RepID=UPI0033D9B2DD